MTSTTPKDHIRKFQELLRELFQFDCAELDFGIYRIMNHKRDILKQFINETLPNLVDTDLKQDILFQQDQANVVLDEAREEVIKSLGPDAIDGDGKLAKSYYQELPVGKAYLDAKAEAASGRSRSAVEIDIYNHLYAFFSRYYQEGDFISKRRYSRNQRYAIPYNGEEVYLHWANSDQYYIKTTEYFNNYDWKATNGVAVHFKLKVADVEQDNVKGKKRFFLPLITETKWDSNTREVTIPFEYRPLTEKEKSTYGKQNYQQDKIITAAIDAIPEQLGNALEALAALMAEKSQNSDVEPITFLEHHLRQYTKRNTSDFFIHKDLKGFLSRELDFYLKNEVLNLDEMSAINEDRLKGWFQMIQLIKSVGSQIIDFLDQIEGFQKMLWEKRKFITETRYCITVGNIDKSFHADIVACEAQWTEWKALFSIDEDESDLFNSGKNKQDRRIVFLNTHPTLVLDTKHFDQDFIDRLLASFGDLDGMTDGLLIHSENYQALNLLMEKYREQMGCIYIDPPYNTNASAILYKNDYKDSSWLAMMADRLEAGRAYLTKNRILCVAIDDEEVWRLRGLLQTFFQKELGIAVVYSNPQGRARKGYFSPAHEYALFYGQIEASPGSLPKTEKQRSSFPYKDELGHFMWDNLIRRPPGDNRQDRPKLFYPIYVMEDDTIRIPKMVWDEDRQEYDILDDAKKNESVIWPMKEEGGIQIEKRWRHGWQKVTKQIDKYRVRHLDDGSTRIEFRLYMNEKAAPKTWWSEGNYAAARFGTTVLKNILPDNNFDFPKSFHLVSDCLRACNLSTGEIALDYFAGSGITGHAVINLNREDDGGRKFILVEMGEYFDTVLLPRIKKITFTPEWKNGKPKRMANLEEAKRSPRIIKYIRLESYEDALNNIEFDDTTEQLKLQDKIDDYLIKYMLKWETKRSQTLLNVEKLTSPFTYQLQIHVNGEIQERIADIPETFNYLLGLKVSTRKVYEDDGRCYLVYRGKTREAPGQEVAIIWRETEGWAPSDFERDRQFVAEQKLIQDVDVIYINGDSCILDAKAIEPVFKARMFA